MNFKKICISNDKDHPFYRVDGIHVQELKVSLNRPNNARKIIQDAIHSESCHGCGKCCRGAAIPVKPDDINFRKHLVQLGKRIEIYHDGRDVFSFSKITGCDFLSDHGSCNCYEHRPSICRTFPFRLYDITHQGVGEGVALAHSCPSISTIRENGIKAVFLSDIIFPISEGMANPTDYAGESRIDIFIQALAQMQKQGKKYYISPFMGSALINIMEEYAEKRTPYDMMPHSPFLMYENEVLFLL